MSENTNTSSKTVRKPQGSASKLEERAAKLKAELDATRAALREKQAQKALLDKARAKKDRTRALIILGLIFTHQARIAMKEQKDNPENAEKRIDYMHLIIRNYFEWLPNETARQQTKNYNDLQLALGGIHDMTGLRISFE